MSKNKKVVALKPAQLSPENYIKNNARSLPIAECLISGDWETNGIANIFIARRHKTGNLTVGVYLVDLYCLGLKGAHHEFNLDPDDYADMKFRFPNPKGCEYTLAHNIIYGSIAYAEDYGFKPHKDFAVARFILEEDDERVEMIELEFGLDGKPCYMFGPNDDEATIRRITNMLKRTAGEGNFTVADDVRLDDDDFDEDADEETFNDNLAEFANYWVEEEKRAYNEYIEEVKKIDKAYDELVRKPQAKEMRKGLEIGKGYKIGDAESDYDRFDTQEQTDEYKRLLDLTLGRGDHIEAIEGALKALKKYPGKPKFYTILQFAYTLSNQNTKADELAIEIYDLYPDYLFAKTQHANLLIDAGLSQGVLSVFNNTIDLHRIYPARNEFSSAEVAAYYACMCRYFTDVDNIDSADLFMDAIVENKKLLEEYGPTVLRTAVEELCNAKTKILMAL